MENNVELEIMPLLPGVVDEKDECYTRLENALQEQRQVTRAHLKRDQSPIRLCLHYDTERVSLSKVKQLAYRSGKRITKRYHHDILQIEGMDCSDCALVIEHSVSRMDGVLSAKVNYADQNLRVEYDARKMMRSVIEKRIVSLGYSIPSRGMNAWLLRNRELLFSLSTGFLILIAWLGKTLGGFPDYFTNGLFILAYIPGGWDTAKNAARALRKRNFDTDLLMLFAAFGAFLLGDFAEGALLIFLFSLGQALAERALDRARSAVRALADLTPKTALVQRGQAENEVPVDQLGLDDVVIIRPGVRIPVDGVVISGQTAVNQAPVTGESIPIEKQSGDQVFAGSINGTGVLSVKVSRLAKDSTLARVMKMVEEAQARKSPTQQTRHDAVSSSLAMRAGAWHAGSYSFRGGPICS
jgi:Cd2+/Zn2+-exporting ATPase